MENTILLSTVLIPFIGSAVGFVIGKRDEKLRDAFNVIMTGVVFLLVVLLYPTIKGNGVEVEIPDIMGTGLFFKLDAFRYIFVCITSLVWFLTTIYSTQYLIKYKKRNRYYAFFILTYASTMGIFLSDQMINLFTFFEIMSFTSYFLIIHDEDEYTHEAGKTYLTMAIAGGMILLMGLFLLYDYTGTLLISELPDAVVDMGPVKYIIAGLIITGFGVKACMMPLHIWLPKSYSAAPTPATAVLSGILAKTGIFGIMITSIVIFNKNFEISRVIFVLGLGNMFWGGFLAIFQRNIKRILAYSSMSQLGYILMGVGLTGMLGSHNNIAIHGTLFHIVNHAVFKVLLFMGAGIIYMILHEVSINHIQGFGKHSQKLKAVVLVGVLSVAGVPGTSGFISKNILHEALVEARHMYEGAGMGFAEIIFIVSSSFTVVYLSKIFISVFIEESDKYWGQFKKEIHKRALLPLVVLSAIAIHAGIRPGYMFSIMEKTQDFLGGSGHVPHNLYTSEVLYNTGIIFMLGAGLYYLIVRKGLIVKTEEENIYRNPTLNWPDLENYFYKPLAKGLYWTGYHLFKYVDQGLVNFFTHIGVLFAKFGDLKIDTGRFKRKEGKTKLLDKPGDSKKKSGVEIKDLVAGIGDKAATSKVKENYADEIESIGQIFFRTQLHMNSIIYALFIFAIILIGILSYLILKT